MTPYMTQIDMLIAAAVFAVFLMIMALRDSLVGAEGALGVDKLRKTLVAVLILIGLCTAGYLFRQNYLLLHPILMFTNSWLNIVEVFDSGARPVLMLGVPALFGSLTGQVMARIWAGLQSGEA